MRFFTEQWYYTGCHAVPEYDEYIRIMNEKLPVFFKTHHSLHDAVIKRIRVHEEYWNHFKLSIYLNSHQAYTPVDCLVFHGKDGVVPNGIVGARWIAEEIFVNSNEYELSVLLMRKDGVLQEMNLSFGHMEVILA